MRTANDFVILEEKNQEQELKERREIVERQVKQFVEEWYQEVLTNRMLEAKIGVPMEDACKKFEDVDMAADLLARMGFNVDYYPEKKTGLLWWKQVISAHLVISPRKGRKRRVD